MSDESKVAAVQESPGAALARRRWDRATDEQRAAVGQALARARKLARRRRDRKARKASE